MPFEMVSGVGRGVGVLDGGSTCSKGRRVLGFFTPTSLNGILNCILKAEMYSTHTKKLKIFPNR